jgi:hypothetical protein
MNRFRVMAQLLALVLLTACVQTNASLMDTSIHLQRTCPTAVRIYSTPARVGVEYQEVALLNSTGVSEFTNESGMMTSMRNKAAEVGATGIIMGNIDEPSAGAKVAAQVFGVSTERKGKSVAIYVPADEDRVRAVCGGTLAQARTNAVSPLNERRVELQPIITPRAGQYAEYIGQAIRSQGVIAEVGATPSGVPAIVIGEARPNQTVILFLAGASSSVKFRTGMTVSFAGTVQQGQSGYYINIARPADISIVR